MPEGILPDVSKDQLKQYKFLFENEFNENHLLLIGINEIKEYLLKKMEKDEVIDKISIKTRQYAKRQSTWARGNMSEWNKIKSNSLNNFLKKI